MTTLNEIKSKQAELLDNLQDAAYNMMSNTGLAIDELESMIDELKVDIEDIESGEVDGDLDAKKSELALVTKGFDDLSESLDKYREFHDQAFSL
ncbi:MULTISPECIES: hypothetical protein [Vibrio]|uniref:hypothetical protein n=1 Tax=Vibrio TaxID=662 RepID=UPI000C84536C|nr:MULTISPECIES: hypothetical protein [Vibrio]PME61925.1 hypothetical protein BCV33_21265 [Vibrio lentus]PTP45906.1 hypothetical protein CWN87_02020 [Vibrio splendidus]